MWTTDKIYRHVNSEVVQEIRWFENTKTVVSSPRAGGAFAILFEQTSAVVTDFFFGSSVLHDDTFCTVPLTCREHCSIAKSRNSPACRAATNACQPAKRDENH